MTFIPLIAFVVAVAWMIRRGYQAKAEYQREKIEEQQRNRTRPMEEKVLEAFKSIGGEQSTPAGTISAGQFDSVIFRQVYEYKTKT